MTLLATFVHGETGSDIEGVAFSGASVQSSIKRSGNYAWKFEANQYYSSTFAVQRTIETFYNIWVRVDQIPSSETSIVSVGGLGGIDVVNVILSPDSSVILRGINDSGIAGRIVLEEWMNIKLRVTSNAHSYISVNGGEEMRCTSRNSQQRKVHVGLQGTSDGVMYADDGIISDVEVNGRVFICLPDKAGTDDDWSEGTGTTFAEVNQIPHDGDTTYIATTTIAESSVFGFQHLEDVTDYDTIIGIECGEVARRGLGFSASVRFRLVVNSSNYYSGSVGPSTGYDFVSFVFSNNPDTSSPWNSTDFNSIELGVEKVSGNAELRVTAIYLIVVVETPDPFPPTPMPTPTRYSFPRDVTGFKLTDPDDSSVWSFSFHKSSEGQDFRSRTIPWEPGLPTQPWSRMLFPFDAGASRTKDLNPRGLSMQPYDPADTFLPEMVAPGPDVKAVTLTSATAVCTKMIQAKDAAGTAVFGITSNTLYRIAANGTVTSQQIATGTVYDACDIVQINGDLIICRVNAGTICRRNASGTMSTSSDVYAQSVVIVRDRIWKVKNSATSPDNDLSFIVALNASDASSLMTLSNWTTATPPYTIGDRTYQCVQLYDNGGTLCGGRADGVFAPDPSTKFLNITPQIARSPDPSGWTGYGCWSAFGYFFVPYHRGVLQCSPGFSDDKGPGTVYLPKLGLRVRTGLEWDRMMYILATDVRTDYTYLIKMIPDKENIADGEYIFQPYAFIESDSTYYGRAMVMSSTVPELFFTGGTAATHANKITLGRGAGRDIDDPNYDFITGKSTVTTGMFTPVPDGSMEATLVNSQVYIGAIEETEPLTDYVEVLYSASHDMMPGDIPDTNMSIPVNGTPETKISESGASILYADTDAKGRFFNMSLELNSSGDFSPVVLAWKASGFMNPIVTDEITCTIDLRKSGSVSHNERIQASHSPSFVASKLRQWAEEGTVLKGVIEGYQEHLNVQGKDMYFIVRSFIEGHQAVHPDVRDNKAIEGIADVTLLRVDYTDEYGV